MSFWESYFIGLAIILGMMSLVWVVSGVVKNASIVDSFWGLGFVLAAFHYFAQSPGLPERKMIVMSLVFIWAIRLSLYIIWRNWGQGEDFRYKQFREDHGRRGYWLYSFRKVFLLQGFLLWIVSAPLATSMYYGAGRPLGWIEFLAGMIWSVGFVFETIGDYQLYKFKSDGKHKHEVLTKGLWKYTRHPNYFGDALIWWAFGLFSIAAGSYVALIGPILMSVLLIKVSGVSLLEETLIVSKPGYKEYIEETNAFFPWLPKK